MKNRPELNSNFDEDTFLSYYYLKSELIDFCKKNGLSRHSSKAYLTEKIAHFFRTGEKLSSTPHRRNRFANKTIDDDSLIEDDFICTEKHRAFFKEKIGNKFTFNTTFQKWLKSNAGKTYTQAISAYYEIEAERITHKPEIEKQFEYNTYIRDFFSENKGSSLNNAIKCWRYKKNIKGHNRYEDTDLIALEDDSIRS